MDNDKYIGRLLDNRYEIQEVIGVGGMAVVYKARCHRLNRVVAVKILKDEFCKDEDFRRRFHAEGQAVAMLNHSNIVSVYDVSTTNEADYIVMELIDGISLKQYMEKKGILNWKETLHFAIQISKALEHAHSRGIVHRDIKPHNVMVLKNGSVKVADFGIARVMSQSDTLTKEALGSVHYISPEQAKGGRVDDRSDIYSLGVVMYEMMAGRPPYDGETPVAVAIQHINGGAKMPSTLNPNIPGGLEQIIMKAMAHDPAARYASATAMLYDMDEFRKTPSILFDYNIPPTDAVTQLTAGQAPAPMPKTTAERVASGATMVAPKRSPVPRHTPSQNGSRRTPPEAPPARRNPPARKRRETYEEEDSRSRIAMIAIIACSLVAIVAIGIFLIVLFGDGTTGASDLVSVPTLVGKVYDNTLQISEDFVLNPPEFQYDEKFEKGQIIKQEPEPGERVEKGEVIYIWVSNGPKPQVKTMEDMVNQKKATAENYLNSIGIFFITKEEHSETIEAGNVTRTEPAANEVLNDDQTVTLWISMGPEVKKGDMPKVINQHVDTAIAILEKQGLKLDIQPLEENSDTVEEDYVIRTEPAAGEKLQTGDKVTLYVSIGPVKLKMPKVMGENVSTAVKMLEAAGFANITYEEYVESDEPLDNVVYQSVGAGEEVPKNTEIVLKLSKGPKVTKDVMFTLLEDSVAAYELVIKDAEGTVVFEKRIEDGAPDIIVPLTGTGVQTFTAYINGMYFSEKEVDFTA